MIEDILIVGLATLLGSYIVASFTDWGHKWSICYWLFYRGG